jgi:hypothetical protein
VAEPEKFWFPAKRYGWGWGLPVTWQGWLVLVVFVSLLVAGVLWFPPSRDMLSFLVYAVFLCGVFGLICFAKGEPPRWRWGDK